MLWWMPQTSSLPIKWCSREVAYVFIADVNKICLFFVGLISCIIVKSFVDAPRCDFNGYNINWLFRKTMSE